MRDSGTGKRPRMTREQERADLDPLAKQRQALEKKANGGDVTAIRELRENHEYWYGSAMHQDWAKTMYASPHGARRLAATHAVIEAAMQGTCPDCRRRPTSTPRVPASDPPTPKRDSGVRGLSPCNLTPEDRRHSLVSPAHEPGVRTRPVAGVAGGGSILPLEQAPGAREGLVQLFPAPRLERAMRR